MTPTVILGIAALAHQFGFAVCVDKIAAAQDGTGKQVVLAIEDACLPLLFTITPNSEVYYEVRLATNPNPFIAYIDELKPMFQLVNVVRIVRSDIFTSSFLMRRRSLASHPRA